MSMDRAVMRDGGGTVLEHVRVAVSIWARFRGLMLRRALASDEGLLIPHCRSVHTCFMRFPIDVVYLSRQGTVMKIVDAMKPYRVSSCRKADSVLEAPAGWAKDAGIRVGHLLRFTPPVDE